MLGTCDTNFRFPLLISDSSGVSRGTAAGLDDGNWSETSVRPAAQSLIQPCIVNMEEPVGWN